MVGRERSGGEPTSWDRACSLASKAGAALLGVACAFAAKLSRAAAAAMREEGGGKGGKNEW